MSRIYGFGNNLHGQIDNNTDNQRNRFLQPVLMAEFPIQDNVVTITAGWSETLIITFNNQSNGRFIPSFKLDSFSI